MIPAPKIIFSDIDGTFLLDDHTVSEKSAEAVRALLASGIPFVLVSARMPEAIYPITQSIGVTIPIISYSGALALTAEGKTLEDVRVDAGAAGMVLSALEDRYPELTVNYYAGRRWYVRDEDDPRVRHEEDITHAKSERGNFDMLLSINTLPSKILLMGEPAVCERAESDLAAAYPMLHVVRSAPNLVEIMEAVGAFVITVAAGVEQELRNGGKMFVRTVGGEPCLHLFIQFEDCGAAVILPVEFAKRSDFLAGESLGTQDQGPFMAAAELFADMLDPGNAQIPVLFVEREAVQDFFFSQQFFDDAEGVVVIQQGTGLGNHSVLVQEPGTEAMDIADKQVLHLTVQPSADPLLHAA